ncbi:uncharacterized protein EI90DRAFT_3072143 [Cantharellus anzutake]|uniref:uncharacterized protein n=1 Tax=Cantharellus anzutake TaxID=1750568 RepID=UPI00190766FB|nr:uncharacterized protein EI90DRAFT_3072143 [Cantharellus anzutake]KAF8325891.1 hypothetical protein EI90DRAFT_3072143 [Cantharellus anzutake]
MTYDHMTVSEGVGRAISSHNLAAFASADEPVAWPLKFFCDCITNDRADLQKFLSSDVLLVRLCRAQTHEYIVMLMGTAGLEYLGGKNVWIRCERRPTLIRLASLPFQDPRASDTLTVSFHEAKLSPDQHVRSIVTRGLKLGNVVDLWRIIERESPLYRLFSLNCWWFASVIWQNLAQLFPGEPPIITHQNLLKRVIKFVGPDTERQTEAVTRMFIAKTGILLDPTTPQTPTRSERRLRFRPTPSRSVSLESSQTSDPPTLPSSMFESPLEECFQIGDIPESPKHWHSHLSLALESSDLETKIVFLVTYRAFANGMAVLDALKIASRSNTHSLLPAIQIAKLWSMDAFKDRHVEAPVREWVVRKSSALAADARHMLVDPVFLNYPTLGHPRHRHAPVYTHPSSILVDPDKLRSRRSGEVQKVIAALRQREMDMRERLLPLTIMEWLEWVYSPHAREWSREPGPQLFNTSEEIYYWVLNTILCEDFEERKEWYRCFLELADRCQRDGNYACMCAIVQALDSDHIRGLKSTVKDTEGKSRVLFQESESLGRIEESKRFDIAGPRLYPLDALRDHLRDSFEAASSDENGRVRWSACRDLFAKLIRINATGAATRSSSDPMGVFLDKQIKEGSRDRASIAERAARLMNIDEVQCRAWWSAKAF